MIQKINQADTTNTHKNIKKAQSFKGASNALLSSLNWMNNNPALSACGVDMCSMVIPRTIVETKNRGKQSGIETFIRESSSAVLNSLIGIIGYISASAVSGGFNRRTGVKAQNIPASGDMIKNMSEIWINSNGSQKKFFENFVNNLKGLEGGNWRSISSDRQKTAAEELMKLADAAKNGSKETKNLKNLLAAGITKDTGAAASFKLAPSNGSKEISASLSELIDSAVSLSNAFKTKSKEQFPDFIQGLIKNKGASALLGLGICAALSVSVQPLNRYFTKRRTGRDAFAGTGGEKDNSPKFKALRTAAGIGFPVFGVSTIGCRPKDIPAALQFNGKVPRISQFKLIYGLTIASRLLFARDTDELRESLIKDTLGFSTWLIFGGFVSKSIARAIGGKDLINNPIAQKHSKKGFSYAKDWLMNSSVKSFEEILLPETKNFAKDGKMMKFKELYQNAAPELKSKVKKAAFAQASGYLFSGVVLGMGIAKLNIFITKKINEHRNAKNKMNQEINAPVSLIKDNTPEVFKNLRNLYI